MSQTTLRKYKSDDSLEYAGYLAGQFMRPNTGFPTANVNPLTTTSDGVSVVYVTQSGGFIEIVGGINGYVSAPGSYMTAAGNDPNQSHQAIVEPNYNQEMVDLLLKLKARGPVLKFKNSKAALDRLLPNSK